MEEHLPLYKYSANVARERDNLGMCGHTNRVRKRGNEGAAEETICNARGPHASQKQQLQMIESTTKTGFDCGFRAARGEAESFGRSWIFPFKERVFRVGRVWIIQWIRRMPHTSYI